MSVQDFSHEGFFYQLGLPPVRVDILMSIPGLRFADAWPNRLEINYGDERMYVISKA